MEIHKKTNAHANRHLVGLAHQHRLKHSKLSRANANRLTRSAILDIVNFCMARKEIRPEASLLLLVMLSGRDIKNILGSLRKFAPELNGEKQQSLYLTTAWPFPQRKAHPSNEVIFRQADNTAYLPVPKFLEDALQQVLFLIVDEEEVIRMAKDFLVEMNKEVDSRFQKVTLARIENVLPSVAHQFDISRAELAVIRNRDYDDDAHSSYGIRELQPLVKNYYKFVESLLGKHLSVCPIVNSQFGSNLTLTDSAVSSIFKHFSDEMHERPILMLDKIRTFNAVTNYVISYLELCTMHRPIKRQFGTLSQFDLTTGFVTLQDKGFDSQRTLPLPPSAVKLLKDYCEYIRKLRDTLIFTQKNIANDFSKMLGSETDLFKHWVRNKLDDYNPSLRFSNAAQLELIPKNWARHYIKTKLLEFGVVSDDIEMFMSHHADHENLYSVLSTFEFQRFSMISEIIENKIVKPLNLSNQLLGE